MVISLISLAYVEEDGLLLSVALLAAIIPHRDTTARVPGSCSKLRRAASTADPGFVFVILQSDAHALGIAEGCPATASCPRIRNHHCHTNSVRIASSLRADMIFGRDSGNDQSARMRLIVAREQSTG